MFFAFYHGWNGRGVRMRTPNVLQANRALGKKLRNQAKWAYSCLRHIFCLNPVESIHTDYKGIPIMPENGEKSTYKLSVNTPQASSIGIRL